MIRPFIPGVSLEKRLRQGPLSLHDTLTLAKWVLLGLEEAHSNGVIHRNIKPSNLIVGELAPLMSAVLVDFGLFRNSIQNVSSKSHELEMVRYMSPEQTGLLNSPVDERSDLYSLGILIYECLSGHCPFEGEAIGEILRQHLTGVPAPSRALLAQFPLWSKTWSFTCLIKILPIDTRRPVLPWLISRSSLTRWKRGA